MTSVQTKMDTYFTSDIPRFESVTSSVAETAKAYLRGLYQSSRANTKRMADVVAGSRYQLLHHMLSESTRDSADILRQLADDANTHFEHGSTALVIDESSFAKNGEH